MKRMIRLFRDVLVSGLLVILPAGLTVFVLWLTVRLVSGIVGPDTLVSQFLTQFFGRYIPGTELLVVIGIVLLVGAVARYWLGKRVLAAAEQRLLTLPMLRKVYSAARQLTHVLLKREVIPGAPQRQLVLVEFPKEGSYVLGILTGRDLHWLSGSVGRPAVSVYIPTAPEPFSGWVLFLPADWVIPLDMTMDEGLSMVLTGGLVVPEKLQGSTVTEEAAARDDAG